MEVRVVFFEGCPNHAPVVALVREVAEDLGQPIDLREIKVESQEEVQRERLLGSPTILVDGRDIDPAAAGRDDFAMSCRVFDGNVGLPPREMLVAALTGTTYGQSDDSDGTGEKGCCS